MNNELQTLAAAFVAAKKVEDDAVAERRRIGKLLEESLPGPDEGTTRMALPGVTVVITRKVNRSVDSNALSMNWGELPKNVQDAFKWEASLVTKQFRAIEQLGTADLEIIKTFVTTKPAASSVTVELKETN